MSRLLRIHDYTSIPYHEIVAYRACVLRLKLLGQVVVHLLAVMYCSLLEGLVLSLPRWTYINVI